MRTLARELSVPESTAYRWVSVGDLLDSRGGRRFNKVKSDHVVLMVDLIKENNRITFQEIVDQIRVRLELQLSKPSVWKHLDMATYALIKITFESEKANISEKQVEEKQICRKTTTISSLPICFMDERNAYIHISRREGRSLKGTRCTTIAAGSKDANVHMIGCMSNAGLLHHEIKRGAFMSDEACERMRRCLMITRFKFDGPVVMMIHNAPCHSGLEDAFKEP